MPLRKLVAICKQPTHVFFPQATYMGSILLCALVKCLLAFLRTSPLIDHACYQPQLWLVVLEPWGVLKFNLEVLARTHGAVFIAPPPAFSH
jgi:hypothetical protein